MLGQDAVTSAREFARRIDVTGLVLTKADGDGREVEMGRHSRSASAIVSDDTSVSS